MRPLLLAVPIVLASFACSSSSSSGDSDAAPETSSNPCANLGCASMPGTLALTVVDASGKPVVSPSFSEDGTPLTPSCDAKTDTGAGTCAAPWTFSTLSEGTHVIDVGAPGYGSQTITVKIEGPSGCCGQGPEVDQTVTLAPAPIDAGRD